MYAIIETGGKQYAASPGEEIQVEKIAGEVGDAVEFDRVLAVKNEDGELLAGGELAGARVSGEISGHGRGAKIVVFKFKRRKKYRRKQGHRQDFTRVKISEINV